MTTEDSHQTGFFGLYDCYPGIEPQAAELFHKKFGVTKKCV